MRQRNEFPEQVSRRQYAIIELLASGLLNRDIARLMGTTENVIKNDLRWLYDKLGLWNRVEVALWWQSRNLAKEPRSRIPRDEWTREKKIKHKSAVANARVAKRTRLDLRQDRTEHYHSRSYEPHRETIVQAGSLRVCRCCGSPLDSEGCSILAGYRRDEQQVRTPEEDRGSAGNRPDLTIRQYDRIPSLAEARAAREKTLGRLPLPS